MIIGKKIWRFWVDVWGKTAEEEEEEEEEE